MKLIIESNDITKDDQLNQLNSELKKLIQYIPNNYEKFKAKEFINTIIEGVEKPEITNKEYLLDWFKLFCEKYEKKITDESIIAIINGILKAITMPISGKILKIVMTCFLILKNKIPTIP